MAALLTHLQSMKNSAHRLVVAIEDVNDLWPIVKEGFEARVPFRKACLNSKARNLIILEKLPVEYILTTDSRLRSRLPQEQTAFWFQEPYAIVVLVTCEKGYESFFGYRMDGNKEEGSSSEDRQPISTAHEIGKSSGQTEKALQIVTAVTMFKQLMENPRFMEFIQSSSIAHQVQGSFGMPGTVFRGMQGMVPNPMYANIGLHPGFQGTQGQFGVSQGNVGMAGFFIPPVNMTPRHQHVTGQGV
ncbi:hypothetical protein L7F22_053603 [Adiantum nelumboides]|nr:hypothetical protein [Adiantum nelumboides]